MVLTLALPPLAAADCVRAAAVLVGLETTLFGTVTAGGAAAADDGAAAAVVSVLHLDVALCRVEDVRSGDGGAIAADCAVAVVFTVLTVGLCCCLVNTAVVPDTSVCAQFAEAATLSAAALVPAVVVVS